MKVLIINESALPSLLSLSKEEKYLVKSVIPFKYV